MSIADTLARLGILPGTDTAAATGEILPAASGAAQAITPFGLILESAFLALAEPFLKIQALAESATAQLDTIVHILDLPKTEAEDHTEAWMTATEHHRDLTEDVSPGIESFRPASAHTKTHADVGSQPGSIGIAAEGEKSLVLRQATAEPNAPGDNYCSVGDLLASLDASGTGKFTTPAPTSAVHSTAQAGIMQNLAGMVRDTLSKIASFAKNAWNGALGDATAESSTLPALPADAFGDDPALAGQLPAMLEVMAEPSHQLVSLFGKTYEADEDSYDNPDNVLSLVKKAFEKWDKIDPEKYAASMVEYLKIRALPPEGIMVGQKAPSVTNVSVHQNIESTGDPFEAARQITNMIEAAGRQLPAASY